MKKQLHTQNTAPKTLASVLMLFALLLASQTLFAHDGMGKKQHRHKHDAYHYDRDYRTPPRRYNHESDRRDKQRSRSHYRTPQRERVFSVPRKMTKRHYRKYESYYYGRSWHRDHNHYHKVYRFPVSINGHYTYQPHAYCDGAFFQVGHFTIHGPVFNLNIRW